MQIDAHAKWNNTQFKLSQGRLYKFTASGTWYDASIACGPEGYKSPNAAFRLLERVRRLANADWFCLVGAFDCDASTCFQIGRGTTLQPSRDGTLTCFANDLPFMYFNNSGSVQLEVTELS